MFGATLMPGIAWSPGCTLVGLTIAINAQQTIIKLADLPHRRDGSRDRSGATTPLRRSIQAAGLLHLSERARLRSRCVIRCILSLAFPRACVRIWLHYERSSSPFTPVTKAAKSAPEKTDHAAETAASDEVAPVEIDLDGLTTRIVALPVAEGRYSRVQGTSKGIAFLSQPIEGTRNQPFPRDHQPMGDSTIMSSRRIRPSESSMASPIFRSAPTARCCSIVPAIASACSKPVKKHRGPTRLDDNPAGSMTRESLGATGVGMAPDA